MAAPTPVTNTKQQGHHGWTTWKAVFTDTNNLTDSVVVNVSDLTTYTSSVKVTKAIIIASPGINVTLEFKDNSADELIAYYPLGATAPLVLDFADTPDGGLVRTGSGGTGDVVLTTLSAAAADEVFVYLEWYVN